jgi:hypothetical protein
MRKEVDDRPDDRALAAIAGGELCAATMDGLLVRDVSGAPGAGRWERRADASTESRRHGAA